MLRRSHDLSELFFKRSIELNANNPLLMTGLGFLYGYMGEPDRGLKLYEQAKIIDPYFDPTWYWMEVGILHFMAHRYERVYQTFRHINEAGHAYLAASCAFLNRVDEAGVHAAAAVRIAPELPISRFVARDPFKHGEDLDHQISGVLKAGLPE